MEEQTESKEPSFSDMTATTSSATQPLWARGSRTQLAYGTGRLPQRSQQISWQPYAGPGATPTPHVMTPSMRSLHQRVVRGEA